MQTQSEELAVFLSFGFVSVVKEGSFKVEGTTYKMLRS
jgi:hypothetical protein